MESRRTEGRSLQEVTLVDSGHVTLSVFNTLGSEGQGRVPSVYRILKKRFSETRKTEVRFGVVKDRRKEFFEVTLAGSGHVTLSYNRGSEGQGRVSTV